MGRRVLDRLVEPVAGGVYATDPDTLEVQTVAPGLSPAMVQAGSLAGAARALRGGGERSGSAVATLTGGLHTLLPPAGRGRARRRRRRADRRARRRGAAHGQPVGGSSWPTVRRSPARAVVLAVPAGAAAALLGTADPGLAVPMLRAPITPVLICTLVLDDHRLDGAPRGTGVLVSAHAAGVRAKALTHATAKWPWLAETAGPGRHVLRLSYGRGDRRPAGPGGSARPSRSRDARNCSGSACPPLPSSTPRWSAGRPRCPRRGPGTPTPCASCGRGSPPRGLAVIGAAVAGSGLAGVVGDARREAAALIKHLGDVASIAPGTDPVAPDRGRPVREDGR